MSTPAQVREYIRYRVPEEQADAFEAAYARAAEPLAAAPQCVDFELARCEEEPDRYILRITWTSTPDHLEGFRGSEHFRAFFAEIRPYVSMIEEMQHYTPTPVRGLGSAEPTLYEWAGGADALERLTVAFYEEVLKDDLLGELFRGMDAAHPRHVASWLGEVFGGPAAYSGSRGGHAGMISHHVGKGITEPQRRRWVSLLHDAADVVGLPADAEFRSAFAAYIEWGTRLAVLFSAPGAERPAEQPMPRWGWGEAPPYRP